MIPPECQGQDTGKPEKTTEVNRISKQINQIKIFKIIRTTG